jgi:hypothetical protein
MLLVPDYATAAAHAASIGLIVNAPAAEQPKEPVIEKAAE